MVEKSANHKDTLSVFVKEQNPYPYRESAPGERLKPPPPLQMLIRVWGVCPVRPCKALGMDLGVGQTYISWPLVSTAYMWEHTDKAHGCC